MRNDSFLPYMVIVAVVAIVAIVSLFLFSGRNLEGAPIYSGGHEEQIPCLDTDPKNDYYTAGVARYGQLQFEDYCLNEKYLYQHQCSGDVELLSVYECPNGCLNGACLAS